MVNEIKEKEFDEVIKEGKVLVDCYASWCGPCQMISPIIEEIASENKEYRFYKLDVDDAQTVTKEYGVMSIPSLLIFNDGKLIDKSVGLKSKSEIKDLLK